MTERIYVLAKNYQHYRHWCHSNNMSDRDVRVRFVSSPEILYGVSAEDASFVYYESWREHPQALEIHQHVRLIESMARYKPENREPLVNEPNDNFWYRLTKLNPALYRGLVVAIFALLGSIGVVVEPNIPDQIIAVIVVLVPILQALWTRQAVTANARVAVEVPDPVSEPHIVVPGEAVTTATNSEIIAAAKA